MQHLLRVLVQMLASGSQALVELRGKSQPSAIIRNPRVFSSLPTLSLVLGGSVWATRGWTYQEAFLSRRCLFFTEMQVHLLCKAMKCCEATVSGMSGGKKSLLSPVKRKLANTRRIKELHTIMLRADNMQLMETNSLLTAS